MPSPRRQQLKRLTNRIMSMLLDNPTSRDSDHKLVANVWYFEAPEEIGKPISQLSAFELLEAISQKKLSSAESIRRIRQKLQEQYPTLRGKTWIKRRVFSKKVRKTINSGNHEHQFNH